MFKVFSDGACKGNPGVGGWGVVIESPDGLTFEKKGASVHTTNNQMELLAVIKGLEALKEPCDVTITSDSSYVVKGINEWLSGWVKKNFVKVKNPELWEY